MSLHDTREIYSDVGLTVLRGELPDSTVSRLKRAIPTDLDTCTPDFDDGNGSVGYILWQRKNQPAMPEHLHFALSAVKRVRLEPEKLRAYQVNIQQPGGAQEFHTDNPFHNSLTIHLSPNGLFEYRDSRRRVRALTVNAGDVVLQHMAKVIQHRGRNPSKEKRYTMALFFNQAHPTLSVDNF